MIEQIPAINLTGTNPDAVGWHRETTFLKSYPPKSDPNVFVIGAFGGVIAGLLIDQLPKAQHWLFEPQDWACRQLEGKFGHLKNVHIRQHGLGDRTATLRMGLYQTDTCSFMRGSIPLNELGTNTPGGWYDGKLVELDEFMRRENLKSIYYASLNIEAYEFVLLPHMDKTGWLKRCENIGISWHDNISTNYSIKGPYTYLGQHVPLWRDMQDLLSKTHRLVLSIDNWQSWVRLEDKKGKR